MLTSTERRAILAEEYRKARANLKPQMIGLGDLARPGFSGAQIAAAKGIARKRALARIDAMS